MTRSQPDVRITVHRLFGEPRDFTLSYPLPPEHNEMLATIRREFGGRRGRDGQVIEDRMHPRLPRATPGSPGGWLTIAGIADPFRGADARRWRLAHWPGSGLPGGHNVPSMMSTDHLESQEYIHLRIDEHGGGFRGDTEKSVATGTRSDVVAFDSRGQAAATFEIEYKDQAVGLAVRRDRAVERAGIPATWLGKTDSRPAWAAKVAWLGTNRREDGLARGSWTLASGHRAIEMEWCGPGSRQDCPLGRNWCGDRHPLWRPRGGTVDNVVDGILGGSLRRFDTGKSVVVATPADCQRWIDYYGTPRVARRVAQVDRRRAALRTVTHNDRYSEAKILAGMRPAPDGRQAPICAGCRTPKWDAVIDSLCMECRRVRGVAPGFERVEPPRLAPVRPAEDTVGRVESAQQAAINLVPAMQTYAELVNLWRLAKRSGIASQELIEACRRRRAEIEGGAA